MSSKGSAVAILALALSACGRQEPPPPPDPGALEARRLLADAGFPEGRGFPRLEVLYNTDEYHKMIAAAIQEMWRVNLGITVELRNVEWPVFMGMVDRSEFDIARRGWIGEYADPLAFLELFSAEAGMNPTGWSSPEYERIIAASNDEADPARRHAMLAKAERLLLDDAPLVPIYHYVAHNLVRPFVRGVHPNSRDMHPLHGVTLEGPGSPKDGVLIFNGGGEPPSLDPALSHDIAGYKILMHLYEGLVMPEAREAKPAPAAAERWDVSPDGRTWTFRLRPAKWSNGDPVTAHDFAWSWRRVVDPGTASRYAQRMYVIEGAREIAQSRPDAPAFGVRALDDRTLEVRLVRRTPHFLQLLCLNIFFPVHRATVGKHGPKFVEPENAVVNGPYRMVEWSLKRRKVFVKNPLYRDASGVKLEKFIFLAVESAETAFNLYEGRQCHWLFRVPPAYTDIPRPDHWTSPYNGSYFYVFNTTKKPLDDVRVRRALAMSIDREKIAKHILRGGETPATRLTPPLYPGYEVP